jgi:hypothetical protein
MTATPKVREALEHVRRCISTGLLMPEHAERHALASLDEALSLLDQLAARGMAEIDVGAISWAYHKLLAFGCQNTSMDNALMLDRLNLMLQGAYQESPDA